MADVLSREQRRICMSRNRGRDTGPEVKLRKVLWARGFRYRTHTDLPGRPDMAFSGPRLAVFVDGCFWHGCPQHGTQPATNREFWQTKIRRNKDRDAKVDLALDALGWRVVRLWEHQIRTSVESAADSVTQALTSKSKKLRS